MKARIPFADRRFDVVDYFRRIVCQLYGFGGDGGGDLRTAGGDRSDESAGGATGCQVAALFFTEATLLAVVIGGIAGFVVGIALAHRLGQSIFGSQISVELVLLPVVLVVAVVVTFGSSAVAIRRAVPDAAVTLRGEA